MFGSFHDLVKPQASQKIPPQMLEYFNAHAPDGCIYQTDENNPEICWLVPENPQTITVEDLKPRLTERQEKILEGEENNPNALTMLMENCLERIAVDATAGRFEVSGKTYSAKDLFRSVDDDVFEKGYTYMFAKPSEFDIPLACGGTRLKVHCKQVSTDNIYVSCFGSVGCPLVMTFELNDKDYSGHYNFRFDNTQSPDLEVCRDAAVIYDGLAKGETSIEGVGPIVGAKGSYEDREPIAPFWQDALDVQDALNAELRCDVPVSKETIVNIGRLHTCLYEDKAVGLGFKPDAITATTDKAPTDTEGKQFRLILPSDKPVRLFGQNINVYACVGLSGIFLGKPEKDREDESLFRYPLTYADDYQCTILYCPSHDTDDSEDNVQHIYDILFAPLPNGRHY